MAIFLTLMELTVSSTTGWPQVKAYLLLLPRFVRIMVLGLLAKIRKKF
jgi:hypothetical protein